MTPYPATDLADRIGARLAHPDTAPAGPRGKDWWRQSLAHGIPGIALLHIELAAAGRGPWQRAHDWLAAATWAPVTSGDESHPYYGAPALAHALACAADRSPGCYQRALDVLDRQIAADARRRIAAAHGRIDSGRLPALAEFDALQGLTGYGAYLLRRDPSSDVLRAVLDYLVRLTDPVALQGETLPGWWTRSGPSGRPDHRFPGGHANSSLAHGITGVLSLLSLAARRGVAVGGLPDAIRTICAWLDHWRTETEGRPTWPYWVTRSELRADRLTPSGPLRPSWCYGTAGLARAQQLAALALGDTERRGAAEKALVSAFTDPGQLAATTDVSLCHGFAGLAHVAARAAGDALPTTAGRLRALIPTLLAVVKPPGSDAEHVITELMHAADGGPGLLDGAAGVALAVLTADAAIPPESAWDSCLLTA
ncbi:lanthionine synthetase C family protein [Streptomyces sp. S07_1.15]|uniref:lanthionine synthetase C family protein n=1 Tax=Streptomyces sp. S07_1.15 TaxID=2873925 RepID=UPI001D14BA68|nr:lanthionine synthetase C family protein [Streptomyces sp. S07_1.15]MCC3650755.1 lanthionine synthetase C family protein [Streptomyces sp. S07_1.15]